MSIVAQVSGESKCANRMTVCGIGFLHLVDIAYDCVVETFFDSITIRAFEYTARLVYDFCFLFHDLVVLFSMFHIWYDLAKCLGGLVVTYSLTDNHKDGVVASYGAQDLGYVA